MSDQVLMRWFTVTITVGFALCTGGVILTLAAR